jgi:hypothetical protein
MVHVRRPPIPRPRSAPGRAASGSVARRSRRLGILAVAAGLVIAAAAQLSSPFARPPLYDGVVVADPYRYLDPLPGQKGDPQPASGTVAVQGGAYGILAIATPEYPPQAQLFASGGAFTLPPGTTSITVDIRPVPPPATAPAGHIAGNVYRISVRNQAGAALIAPASARVSVVLRAPDGVAVATLERFAGGAWQPLDTSAETSGMFLAVATEFGDFAMVAPGAAGSGAPAGPTAATGVSAAPVSTPGTAAAGQPSVPAPSATPAGGGADTGGISPLLLVGLVAVLVVGLVLFGLSGRQ